MDNYDERRDYYRITDTVGLQVEHCDESDIPNRETFAAETNEEFKLINHLSRMDLDNSALLHSIQDSSPDVARYLKLINSKIEAIAKQIVSMGLTDEVDPTEVMLSAGGLSYISEDPAPESGFAKLRMILYPSNAVITSYGRLVRTGPMDDGYEVAFEYNLIHESDRDTLVRHVLQLQSNSLRKRATDE